MQIPARTRVVRLLVAAAFPLATFPAAAAVTAAPCDTVTFGAILINDRGGWGDLSGEAGCRKGDLVGHVDYVEHSYTVHGTPFHMRSTAITGYFFDPSVPNARDICGVGIASDGGSARFRIRVQDNGHPGHGDFAGIVIDSTSGRITVSTRNLVLGYPGGGNVTLHQGNGTRSGSGFFTPDEAQACGGLPPP